MPQGTVKWFNSDKGYGFIAPDDGSADVFVHHSTIKIDGFRTLQENQRVEYTPRRGARARGRPVFFPPPPTNKLPGSRPLQETRGVESAGGRGPRGPQAEEVHPL